MLRCYMWGKGRKSTDESRKSQVHEKFVAPWCIFLFASENSLKMNEPAFQSDPCLASTAMHGIPALSTLCPCQGAQCQASHENAWPKTRMKHLVPRLQIEAKKFFFGGASIKFQGKAPQHTSETVGEAWFKGSNFPLDSPGLCRHPASQQPKRSMRLHAHYTGSKTGPGWTLVTNKINLP